MNKQQSQKFTLQPCGCQEPHDPCEKDCGRIVKVRNRYYTGKYMTARDFQDEQNYFLNRHRLHNRLLHGWGIVCGLEVEYHPDRLAELDTECARRWVRVRPGIAIDCCGRELVVTEDRYYELPLPETKGQIATSKQTADQQPDAQEQSGRREQYILGLHYGEQEIERGPVLYAEDVCDGRREQANRLCECACLVWDARGDLPRECWAAGFPSLDWLEEELLLRLRKVGYPCSIEQLLEYVQQSGSKIDQEEVEAALKRLVKLNLVRYLEEEHRYEAVPEWPCRDDCAEGRVSQVGTCLDPNCSCGLDGLVPLALIEFDPDNAEWVPGPTEVGFTLDILGRKELPPSPDQLTHIAGYNWPHGGMLLLTDLAKPREEGGLGGQLEVYFDRKLLPPSAPTPGSSDDESAQVFNPVPYGVNALTFFVEWHRWSSAIQTEESWYRLRLLHDREGSLPHIAQNDHRCTAVYPLPADLLEGDENIGDSWLRVVLKCDFILDCRGIPVDGEHLRGRYLTGDGLPGGTFESWFYVQDDLPRKQQKKFSRR